MGLNSSRRILVQYAHPAHQRSLVNAALRESIEGMPGVTINDLYEAYPRFDVDVAREQALLVEHDIILFQHPFYWYSVPALVREWQDLVLQHGWAYGREGTALRGKWMMNVLSTGGAEQAYCAKGANRFTVGQLLAPHEQTARLCGMTYLPPFVVHGTHLMSAPQREAHALRYRAHVQQLVEASAPPLTTDASCHVASVSADHAGQRAEGDHA